MTTAQRPGLGLKDFFLDPGRLVNQPQRARAWLPWIGLAFCGYLTIGLALPAAKLFSLPLIFALTAALGVPTLYIFDALAGSRLTARQIMTISLISLVIPGVMLLGYLLPLAFLGLTIGVGDSDSIGGSGQLMLLGLSVAVIGCALLSIREVGRLLKGSSAEELEIGAGRKTLHRIWMVVQLAIVVKLLAIYLWN